VNVPSEAAPQKLPLILGILGGIVSAVGIIIAFLFIRKYRKSLLPNDERRPLLSINDSSASGSSAEDNIFTAGNIAINHFEDAELLERLGSGGSGTEVFRCNVAGYTCAVKVMDMSLFGGDTTAKEEFLNEVNLLFEASRRSDHVVRYLHHVETAEQCRLFMEYCPTTLSNQMDVLKRNEQRFKPGQIGRICRPILMALAALHSGNAPILHRDLKAANVFAAFDRFGNVVSIKLGDFGISKLLEHGAQAKTVVGTPGYIPPEVLRRSSRDAEPYTTAADIYSFGMILFELLALKAPYSEYKWDNDRCDAILSGKIPDLPPLSDEYKGWVEVFHRCISHDPAQRPRADQLLLDPIFNK
jgi:NIMA (never in mitosis gene a)-related kinase 2